MLETRIAFFLWLGAALLATGHAFAAEGTRCAPHDAMQAGLVRQYGETRQAIGLAGEGALIELYANPATGSWTLTLTRPDGESCLLGAGSAFEILSREPLPAGDPA